MKTKPTIIILFCILLFSCQNNKKNSTNNIDIFSDTTAIEDIADKYIEFVNQNPNDAKAADYLLEAAKISIEKKDFKKAIFCIILIEENYPDYPQYPEVILTKAYIYGEHQNNKGMARECYEMFIEKFPDNEHVETAKAMLELMYMSDEDIIKKFEEKNNQ